VSVDVAAGSTFKAVLSPRRFQLSVDSSVVWLTGLRIERLQRWKRAVESVDSQVHLATVVSVAVKKAPRSPVDEHRHESRNAGRLHFAQDPASATALAPPLAGQLSSCRSHRCSTSTLKQPDFLDSALHNVRHSYAKRSKPAISAKVVSERLSDASAAFTLQVYSHVIPGNDEQAASAVASLILRDPPPNLDADARDRAKTPRERELTWAKAQVSDGSGGQDLNLRPLGYEPNLTLPEIVITHMKDEHRSRQRLHRRSLPSTSHCRHPATFAYRSLTDDLGAGKAGWRLIQGRRNEAYVPDLLAGRRFRLDGDVAADVADPSGRSRRWTPRPRRLSTPKRWPGSSCAPSRWRRRTSRASWLMGGGSSRPRQRSRPAQQVSDATAEEVLGNIRVMT
jgi:hypothetical protein